VPGSEDRELPLDELRLRQERELAISHALACMEHELAHEAFIVGDALRQAGIEFHPLTFIALRILETCAAERIDFDDMLDALSESGSLNRSVDIASDLLDQDAA
jgi:hypothetical protein